MFGDSCGWLAMIGSSFLYMPQIQHMVRLQSGAGVSYSFLMLSVASGSLWLCYGLEKGDQPVIFCNLSLLSMTLVMAILKHFFSTRKAELYGQLGSL